MRYTVQICKQLRLFCQLIEIILEFLRPSCASLLNGHAMSDLNMRKARGTGEMGFIRNLLLISDGMLVKILFITQQDHCRVSCETCIIPPSCCNGREAIFSQ